MPHRYVVAVDVGGTTIKSALVATGGQRMGAARRATPREHGPAAVIESVLDVVTDAAAAGHAQMGHPPEAIGLACLGWVDEQAGIALSSGAIGWQDVPLRSLVSERTGLPVALGHDVRAGALAEARYGAGRDHDSFLSVAIGTGIGAAIVLAGRPYPGRRGKAGELGHIVVEPGGYECGCGGRGCLEAEAAGIAISKRYREATNLDRTAREIVELSRSDDPIASQIWLTTADRLGRGLAAAATLLDPDLIVVGGGVALAGEQLFPSLREAMGREFRIGCPPPIVPAALGDGSACIGAGILAWELASHEIGATR